MFYLVGENNEYPMLNMNQDGTYTLVKYSVGNMNIREFTGRIDKLVAAAGGADNFLKYYPIAILNVVKLDVNLINSNYKNAVDLASTLLNKLFGIDIMAVVYSDIRFYNVKGEIENTFKYKYLQSLTTPGVLPIVGQEYYTDVKIRKLVSETSKALRYFIDNLIMD